MAEFYVEPKNDDPQRIIELNGVPSRFYLTALEVNTIVKFLAALLGLETALYKGEYPSLAHLEFAHPLAEPGSEAQIIVIDGDNLKASWDNTNKKWFMDGVYVAPGSNAAYLLKSVHDANNDGIIDKAKDIHAVLTAGGTKYYGTRNGVVGVFDFPTTGGTSPTNPTTYLQSYLIAWTGTGWEYQVTVSFVHNGISYTDSRKLTLTPDGVYDRFARFVVNLQTLQAAVILGDPSANPLEPGLESYHLDSDRLILIPANSVAPPNINVKVVYGENLGAPQEFNINPPGPDFDLANGESPKSGAVAIKGTDLNQSQSVSFSTPDPVLISDAKFIAYDIQNIVGGAHTIGIQGARSNGQLRTIYLAAPSSVGYDPANTASYQTIILPIPSDTLVNIDRISVIAGFDGMGYYLDNIRLQSGEGVTEPVGGNYVTPEQLAAALDLKVDKVAGKGLSTEDYTTAEKTKLAGLEVLHKGTHLNLAALQTAYPEGAGQNWHLDKGGWTADVDAGVGASVVRYLWDANDLVWRIQQGETTAETAESIATKYHSNAGIEAFTTTLKNKLDSITAIFTTALKSSYDTAASWVSTNGQNVLDRLGVLERAPIVVNTSRLLTANDHNRVLLVTAPITLTWPAGGIANFKVNFDVDASGTLTIADQAATPGNDLDAATGKILEAGKMGHAYSRPDNGKLRLKGDWIE